MYIYLKLVPFFPLTFSSLCAVYLFEVCFQRRQPLQNWACHSVSQSLSQSHMFQTNWKSGRQGWIKLRIKPFNGGKYGLPRSSMVPMGPVWSRLVPYGRFQYYLTIWFHIIWYGCKWSSLVPHSLDLSCLVLFGPVWSNLALGLGLKKSCMLSIENNGSNWSCLFLIGHLLAWSL